MVSPLAQRWLSAHTSRIVLNGLLGEHIMKWHGTILVAAWCVLLGACDMPDTTMANGAVTLKDGVVTLKADGAPNAMIDSTGDLQIGDKTINVTSSQHGLLMLYYQGIQDVHDTGVAMGKAGASIGTHALKEKLSGKSKEDIDKDATAGGQQMRTMGHKICQDQVNIKTVQNQLAAQLREFKPYSTIFTDDNTKCDKDDDSD
jgi:hypothetical protein